MTEPVSVGRDVKGGLRWLLRAEGGAVFLASLFAYSRFGDGWSQFFILFLVPDISLLGYLGGSRIGAACYNAAHSYIGPLIWLAVGLGMPSLAAPGWVLIWLAHLGLDRGLGYGLKYADGFGYTHLGLIGRWKLKAAA